MRGRIGALAAMDEAGMRALQRAKEFFVARMKSGEVCPLPVAATTAWMQEVERSRMPEPKAPATGIGTSTAPWEALKGTSRNYLRCHRCVKNRLRMLIYNT